MQSNSCVTNMTVTNVINTIKQQQTVKFELGAISHVLWGCTGSRIIIWENNALFQASQGLGADVMERT